MTFHLYIFLFCLCIVVGCGQSSIGQRTLKVPEDFATIQAAIDAASDNDVIEVASGIYEETLIIEKNVTLTGAGRLSVTLTSPNSPIIIVNGIVSISGFSIIGPQDGIEVRGSSQLSLDSSLISNFYGNGVFTTGTSATILATLNISNCIVVGNRDGLGPEFAKGVISSNTITDNADDGIDVDGDCEFVIKNNVIARNGDDGIEIRPLHQSSITLRSNYFYDNGEDGIELFESPLGTSDSIFNIQDNTFFDNDRYGIGCVSNDTEEADITMEDKVNCASNLYRSNAIADISASCPGTCAH